MAGVADGRGGGRTQQSQYSVAIKSGVNSQKALFILMRVPIPISKVRYQKEAMRTPLSHWMADVCPRGRGQYNGLTGL